VLITFRTRPGDLSNLERHLILAGQDKRAFRRRRTTAGVRHELAGVRLLALHPSSESSGGSCHAATDLATWHTVIQSPSFLGADFSDRTGANYVRPGARRISLHRGLYLRSVACG